MKPERLDELTREAELQGSGAMTIRGDELLEIIKVHAERLRTCGQHPTLGDVTLHGSRACGRVLSVIDLYRCADCQTAFCRDCIRRHFADEAPETREATRKAELRAYADADDPRDLEDSDDHPA